jgi:hypothetical protein
MNKIVACVAFISMIVMCITILCCQSYYNKPKIEELPKTGIWIETKNKYSWQPDYTFIMKDYNRNLQWTFIQIGNQIVMVPGTEKTLEK